MARRIKDYDAIDVLEFEQFLDGINKKITIPRKRKNGRYREFRNTEKK